MKTYVDWNCNLSRLSTKYNFSIRSVTLSFYPCMSILAYKYQSIRVCCLDDLQDLPLLCLNGLNYLLQCHHLSWVHVMKQLRGFKFIMKWLKLCFQAFIKGCMKNLCFLDPTHVVSLKNIVLIFKEIGSSWAIGIFTLHLYDGLTSGSFWLKCIRYACTTSNIKQSQVIPDHLWKNLSTLLFMLF